ncbi:hypothetical protein M758_8G093600 [Ceratodon purpureus]|nr:hypothetical protein M758_8G093600 [Ceratodon purpureus]
MIVAKFRISWMFAGGLHRVILMYLLLVWLLIFEEEGLTVTAQGPDPGTLYLDQKELAVKWIAGNATLNNGNCGSLDNCKAACSRVTCHPLSGESRQCTSVDFNEHHDLCPCVADESKMLIDYSRSFVTLPAPASTTLQTEVARDICLQRKLDSTFKNVSFSSNYNFVYFGSTSGAFRSFPGREKDESQCTSYDPRNRFWYLNGISVFKDVKILVDVANSMGNAVTGQYNHSPGTTYLDVAKNITLTLLDTIYIEDIVEVFSFDSTNATSLGGAFHVYSSYNDFNPRPELTALMISALSSFLD